MDAGIFAMAYLFGAFALGGLWLFVPFAVFGIKPLLKQLIAEQQATRALLHAMASPAQRDLAEEYCNPPAEPSVVAKLRERVRR